jgi:steroid delta-isomerase-like uncharacterized protein
MHPHEILVRRWYDEVWNQGSEASLEALLHADARAHDFPYPGDIQDRGSFQQSVRHLRSIFGEFHVTVHEVVANDDLAFIRWSVDARHTGDGLGFPATHRPVAVSGMTMVRVRDGQIEEGWNAFDFTRVVHDLQAASHPTGKPGSPNSPTA